MLKIIFITTLFVITFITPTFAQDNIQENIAEHLQNISVTIRAKGRFSEAQGSGVIITRELTKSKGSTEKTRVNFIWTAGHVVKGLRNVRTIIDPKTGTSRKIVEFRDINPGEFRTKNKLKLTISKGLFGYQIIKKRELTN